MTPDPDTSVAGALALLDEHAEDLYEDAPCGYLSTLPDGSIVRVNRTFEGWTGHRREALLAGMRLQDLLTPGGRIYHETHVAPLLQMQGTVQEIAVELRCADGRRLPVLLNAVLRRDGDGTPRVIRATVFDASDRRRYEQELLAARRRAERLHRHTALLAETGRVLDEAATFAGRAQRLVDLLAARAGTSAVLWGVGAGDPVATAGHHPAGADLHAARTAVLATRSPALGTTKQALAAPLQAHGRLLGVVGLERRGTVERFDDDDLALIVEMADRAALALENARLYEHEHEVALVLQRSMLAGELPTDARYELGAHYAPAVKTLEIGGDWYDAFPLDGGHLVLVMGDVVGRGLEAATSMGQLRSAVRALAGARLGPAGVLEHLDGFVERTGMIRGATLAYAELDLSTGRLRLACAGHPPPVLLPPHGEPSLVWEGRSGPLGAYSGPAVRAATELALEPGSRLVFYTDGLVERRDRPIDVGIEALMAQVAGRRGAPVAEDGAALAAALLDGGHGEDDDVCSLTLAFGAPARFERRLTVDVTLLAGLRAQLRTWLEWTGVGDDDREALVLACSEAAANAMEHGYRHAAGEVQVAAAAGPGEVVITVRDRGSWRHGGSATGRGRGMTIVEHLMDEVHVDRDAGTSVRMRRRLGEAARR